MTAVFCTLVLITEILIEMNGFHFDPQNEFVEMKRKCWHQEESKWIMGIIEVHV